MEMDTLSWEEPLAHRMKLERNLNFSTISNEEDEFGFSRKKTARDPMSHRIIEKRRRDRMNNCLADLSRLVPTNYLKKGRGRIEKTEIIEMAIKHLKHLQAHPCKDPANCEVAKTTEQDHKRQYRLGYQECMSETVRFMVESEGLFSGDGVCVRLINHLQKHYDKVAGGMCYTQALGMMVAEESKSSLHMDVDGHSGSCFPSDACSDNVLVPEHVPYTFDNRTPDIMSIPPPELKQEEVDSQPPSSANPQEPIPKVTSQLREMLQNPGLPKDRSRSSSSSNGNCRTAPVSPQPPRQQQDALNNKTENEVYKFKNNIKHRFNNDLRHHTSSPTDSHSSLPDDDHNNNNSVHINHNSVPNNHNGNIHLKNGNPVEDRLAPSCHSFASYPDAPHELSVKIPDRTLQHWDSHAETASSCGSNPSPPPNAGRSNGSSSGYSTNGDSGSKPKPQQSSPALSPYSRTPDRLSNRSPSPQPGVPIFALHPKGTFYIPLTVEASLLTPYLTGLEDLAPVLHPVSICVNFSICHAVKVNGSALQYRHSQQPPSSYLMDKFQDRYVYPDGHSGFYPYSPARNGCS